MVIGDLDDDGDDDFAISTYYYYENKGKIYIFYNDGSYASSPSQADEAIEGDLIDNGGEYFGAYLQIGDFDYDGDDDLAASSNGGYGNGGIYIFYNDGNLPNLASGADVVISGKSNGDNFGGNLSSGDFSYDGEDDLAISAWGYNGFMGRAYIFYSDGSIPTTANSADVIIDGQNYADVFYSIESGDLNDDGRIDLVVGAVGYNNEAGRIYIFNNDGSYPSNASGADNLITGDVLNSGFGSSLIAGDFNADGKEDLVVSSAGYLGGYGRIYIFYNDGAYPVNESGADVTINGTYISYEQLGVFLEKGDFNNDGRVDLVASSSSRIFIFYNDGAYPANDSGADVIIGDFGGTFSNKIATIDLNSDGRMDLVAGNTEYSSNVGRVYIFYNDGSYPSSSSGADAVISGVSSDDYFGSMIKGGDINNDNRDDLIISARGYSGFRGMVYIFYNDGSLPAIASGADVMISGEEENMGGFGSLLEVTDLDLDQNNDLVIFEETLIYIFYDEDIATGDASSASLVMSDGIFGVSSALNTSKGDLNADGRDDLIFGGYDYTSSITHVYVIYSDGTYSNNINESDIVINAEFIIQGGFSNYQIFGGVLATGDLNADGKSDLIVGDANDSGRVYVFYSQNGQISAGNNFFDSQVYDNLYEPSFTKGDFDDDGDDDLAIGEPQSELGAGKVFIFYNDGSIPESISAADEIIAGVGGEMGFGLSVSSGDFDGDGDDDLAVAEGMNIDNKGCIYIFHNDGDYPADSSGYNAVIVEDSAYVSFAYNLTNGDLDGDGDDDLIASDENGYIYIFYNDESYPSSTLGADAVISNFTGNEIILADINNNGSEDIVFSTIYSGAARVSIIYSDGSYPADVSGADVSIAGAEYAYNFGYRIVAGKFDGDSDYDLAVADPENSAIDIFYNDGSFPTDYTGSDLSIGNEMTEFLILGVGDFDDDNDEDLVFSDIKNIYFFYNDGSYPTNSDGADVVMSAENAGLFVGFEMLTGDFDADGDDDLATLSIEAISEEDYTIYFYLYYNDGSYPALADNADLIISGDKNGSYLGTAMASGDFNSDGKTDLAVGAYGYSSNTGRVFIFYNKGAQLPTASDSADIIITGESTENFFGFSLSSGDLNNDNQTDLIIGAKGYSTNKGRVYIIYNDGSYPTLASDADIKIDGENNNDNFGYSITTGDIAGDSRADLIIGATGYSTNTGRTYIINNDGSIPTLASNADTIITGENSNDNFGISLITGDFDYDMDNDLVIGSNYNSNTGRAYIFNNDGSYPNLATNSDIKIDGESANNYFSNSFTKGDFNNDNRIDLVVGAYGYVSNTGRVYIFNNDGSIPTTAGGADDNITGESSDNYFGYSMSTGDYNADNKIDLVSASKMGGLVWERLTCFIMIAHLLEMLVNQMLTY